MRPIAYADKTGYVWRNTTNSIVSEEDMAVLTPLYTQAQIDESMEKFYAAQGLDKDGNPLPETLDVDVETAEHLEAIKGEARAKNVKSITGVSIAEAARAALNGA